MLTATVNALRNAHRVDLQLPIEPDAVKEREMKQVLQRVIQQISDDPAPVVADELAVDEEETAVDLANRSGFSKFLYYYEQDGHKVVVDVLDPERTGYAPS